MEISSKPPLLRGLPAEQEKGPITGTLSAILKKRPAANQEKKSRDFFDFLDIEPK